MNKSVLSGQAIAIRHSSLFIMQQPSFLRYLHLRGNCARLMDKCNKCISTTVQPISKYEIHHSDAWNSIRLVNFIIYCKFWNSVWEYNLVIPTYMTTSPPLTHPTTKKWIRKQNVSLYYRILQYLAHKKYVMFVTSSAIYRHYMSNINTCISLLIASHSPNSQLIERFKITFMEIEYEDVK